MPARCGNMSGARAGDFPLPLLPIVHGQEVVLAAEEGRLRCNVDVYDGYDNDDGVDDAGGGDDDDDRLSF